MKSKVIQLPDLNEFHADPEVTTVIVSEEELQNRILHLSKEYGETVRVNEVTENCGVICMDDKGEKVYLYPSLELPLSAQADQAVKDKKVGDTFSTVIAGKELTLIVKQILLYKSCEIDDTLAKKAGYDGVETLEELKESIQAEIKGKKRQELCRMLVMEMQDFLCEHAALAIDQEEADSWCKEQARLSYEENMSMGIDLRFTEDGEMLTEEEALSQMSEDMKTVFISMLVNQKFCEDRGITSEKDGIEAENEFYPFVYQELSKLAEEMMA